MVNLKPNSNEPIEIWKKIGSCIRLARHFAELISDILRSISGGQDLRYGIWNQAVCLLCQRVILSEFTQRLKITKSKTKHMSTPNMNERKWQLPRLHLVTKSCVRWELGLLTASAAVLPLKMMPCTMFQSVETFSVNGKFTEHYHIFCARIDLLFTISVCSRYGPGATIRLLHDLDFVMCINSRLYCTHFSCHRHKICNVSRRLMQISKKQHDPCRFADKKNS